MRDESKYTIRNIVDYWSKNIDNSEIDIPWENAHMLCWSCGIKSNLQKCHIIPHALGGKGKPSNLVLLCINCHKENPNVNSYNGYWDWLKSRKRLRGGGKVAKEYEFIYGTDMWKDASNTFKNLGITSIDFLKNFDEFSEGKTLPCMNPASSAVLFHDYLVSSKQPYEF